MELRYSFRELNNFAELPDEANFIYKKCTCFAVHQPSNANWCYEIYVISIIDKNTSEFTSGLGIYQFSHLIKVIK